MLKLWGKIYRQNRLCEYDEVVCDKDIEYEKQLKECITEICYRLDIQKPYWLQKNLVEYNSLKKTSFTQDNFIEEIDFNRFEIEVLEEK